MEVERRRLVGVFDDAFLSRGGVVFLRNRQSFAITPFTIPKAPSIENLITNRSVLRSKSSVLLIPSVHNDLQKNVDPNRQRNYDDEVWEDRYALNIDYNYIIIDEQKVDHWKVMIRSLMIFAPRQLITFSHFNYLMHICFSVVITRILLARCIDDRCWYLINFWRTDNHERRSLPLSSFWNAFLYINSSHHLMIHSWKS